MRTAIREKTSSRYDTAQCILGIAYIDNWYSYKEGESEYIPFSDSLKTLADYMPIVRANDRCQPLEFWLLDLPSSASGWNGFIVDRYDYEKGITGVPGDLEGEFGDTIRIPITSSFIYDRRCGYDHRMSFPFGELVLVKHYTP